VERLNPPKFRLIAIIVAAFAILAPQVYAGDWGVSISPGGWGFHYGSGSGHIRIDSGPLYYPPPPPPPPPVYVRPYPNYYYPSGAYYPRYNPVVRRDITDDGYVAPDGTVHSETTVEDRHGSYYSPGRNEAITRPRTTVTDRYNPYTGEYLTQERTTWIGADGRPHSTTVDRSTSQDAWGDTHTDTHVTLKSKKVETPPSTEATGKPEGTQLEKAPVELKKQK